MNERQYLNKDERSLINRRAYELSLETYPAYRERLIEWAINEKMSGRQLDAVSVARITPDISDSMEGGF